MEAGDVSYDPGLCARHPYIVVQILIIQYHTIPIKLIEPARSVCLVALSLSEAGPGRFGGQVSVIVS